MKCELTEEQRKNLLKYYELIRSNDEESILLGIQLFYDEFKNFRCPHRKYQYYSIIFTDFFKLREPNYPLDWFNCYQIYWIERIADLTICGFYYD